CDRDLFIDPEKEHHGNRDKRIAARNDADGGRHQKQKYQYRVFDAGHRLKPRLLPAKRAELFLDLAQRRNEPHGFFFIRRFTANNVFAFEHHVVDLFRWFADAFRDRAGDIGPVLVRIIDAEKARHAAAKFAVNIFERKVVRLRTRLKLRHRRNIFEFRKPVRFGFIDRPSEAAALRKHHQSDQKNYLQKDRNDRRSGKIFQKAVVVAAEAVVVFIKNDRARAFDQVERELNIVEFGDALVRDDIRIGQDNDTAVAEFLIDKDLAAAGGNELNDGCTRFWRSRFETIGRAAAGSAPAGAGSAGDRAFEIRRRLRTVLKDHLTAVAEAEIDRRRAWAFDRKFIRLFERFRFRFARRFETIVAVIDIADIVGHLPVKRDLGRIFR